MKHKPIILTLLALLALAACRDKDLDMTVVHKTLYDGATMTSIHADDAWDITVVHDDHAYVTLDYCAFLEDYLAVSHQGTTLSIGLNKYLNLPANTVMNAVVHTASVENLHFSDAVTATLQGVFPETTLKVDLDNVICKGGNFSGTADVHLSAVSTMADFDFNGTTCTVTVDEGSTFKGTLNASSLLTIRVDDESWMTTYGGQAPQAEAEVNDASSLNMLATRVETLSLTLSSASETSVNATNAITGSVKEASTLYYKGNPIITIDVDSLSSVYPL